jgi:16S rRNA (uracil1498-N3)-methyltransferase
MKQLVLPAGSRSGDLVTLEGKEHHYLARVRRIASGERIAALDGGRTLLLEVTEVGPARLTLRVVEQTAARQRGTRVVLFPFLLKSRKLDDVVRQAGEAGVAQVVPVLGDHCVSRPEDTAGKNERWSAIAREAAQQSGNEVCEVLPALRSRELPSWWSGAGPLLFFHQQPLDNASLHRYLFSRPEAVGLIVGPEGGLSDEEVAAFRSGGALPVWLGPFVLRAETASLYAVAAVNAILQESREWTIPT